MKNDDKKAYCACLTLERVIEREGDHNIETSRWRCANCGKERELCLLDATGTEEKSKKESKLHTVQGGDGKLFHNITNLTEDQVKEIQKMREYHYSYGLNCGKLQERTAHVEADKQHKLEEDLKKPETNISWPTREAPDVLYTIQTTEESKVRGFVNLGKVHSLIWEFENWLRQQWKYNSESYTEAQYKTLEATRDEWYRIKEETGIDLDE